MPPDSVYEYRHLIEDRIVLYGAMTEEADMHYTPMGKIAGVKLLAYAIETLLKHNEIKEVPMWVTWLLNFLLMVMTILVFDYYDRWVAKRGPLAKVLDRSSSRALSGSSGWLCSCGWHSCCSACSI